MDVCPLLCAAVGGPGHREAYLLPYMRSQQSAYGGKRSLLTFHPELALRLHAQVSHAMPLVYSGLELGGGGGHPGWSRQHIGMQGYNQVPLGQ